jgi:peptidoglycan hydrolase-like protein with peptidoglycan-binding domain
MRNLILVIFASLLFGVFVNAQTETAPKKPTDTQTETRKKSFRPTKSQITEAQEKLKSAGTYNGATDGKYNNDFRTSIKTYQETNNLEKNGKLDEETLLKMGIELTDSQKGIESPDSSSGKTKRTSFRPTKEQISQVQKMFKTKGTYSGTETGKYDDDLRAAIRDFQTANGLKRSGSLNRATLEKLGIVLTESQMAIPVNQDDFASADDKGGETKKRGAVFRATAEQITEVQEKLKTAKLYSGESDGKFNDDFRQSIRDWQRANNVKVTGTLNKVTLIAMGIELTDKQKEM